MQTKRVVKFGGSNLKSKEDIKRIIRVIQSYEQPPVIVVSAFYGITDYLNGILNKVRNGIRDVAEIVSSYTGFITKMKKEVIVENITDKKTQEAIAAKISERLKELERYLMGVHYIGVVPDFIEDVILSYGERFSSLMLTALLREYGIDCQEALPEQIRLITDGEFGNASVDFALSAEPVKNYLQEDKVFIVPGFYGISQDGSITLLGRGGSDYSAASIAACLDAASLDVWKDVDGFMSADPKLVERPTRLKTLTYSEAAELAYFGAKILHPRTVEPLMDKKIPVRIFNITKQDATQDPLSVVNSKQVVHNDIIKSVTYSDDFCMLKLRGPGIGIKHGVLAKVTNALDRQRINIKSVITSQITINLLLSRNDISKAYKLINGLNLRTVKEIIAMDNISVIAVVGEGLLEKEGIAARLFGAVARKKINIEIISLGASHVVSYFIVDKKDRKEAIQEIHEEFFNT